MCRPPTPLAHRHASFLWSAIALAAALGSMAVGCTRTGSRATIESHGNDMAATTAAGAGPAAVNVPGKATAPAPRAWASAPSRATAAPTAGPTDGPPDAHGYLERPDGALDHGFDYVALEAPPAGAFLAALQQRLDAADAAWLSSTVADEDGGATLALRALDGDKAERDVPAASIATALSMLARAGSRPVIQGYFANRGGTPVGISWEDAAMLATVDTLDVVVSGWRGGARALAPLGSPVPGTAVWRFVRSGDTWRWRSWRWSHRPGYAATLEAIEGILDDPAAGHITIYHIVRPTALMPAPAAEPTLVVPSPDGGWVAREVGGPFQTIDPRDPASSRSYVGIEVEHLPSGRRWTPIARWESGAVGSATPRVIGWRRDSAELVVATQRCGDGCVTHCHDELALFDGRTGTTRPLDAATMDATLDPTGRYVAGFAGAAGGPPSMAVVVADLDAGTVARTTFAAEEVMRLVWAPDGSALAFTIADRYAMCAELPSSHLVRYDVASNALNDLTPSDERARLILRWNVDDTLDVAAYGDGMVFTARPPDAIEVRDALTGALRSEATPTAVAGKPIAP